MAKYLFHGSYTQNGVKGLLKEGGSSRNEFACAQRNGPCNMGRPA